jgi:putative nucleotidyltransferase with HDIG domain
VRKQHLATIAALSKSMEAKDYYTGGHTERVAEVSVALAKRLGYSGADLDAIEIGALLHDIGKIGIPERILQKAGPLDDDEWKVMKEHPIISEYILSEVDLPPIVLQIARHSHERLDGAGYPDGLAGEEIPLPARIVLVADAFDAITTDRPYRKKRHVLAAIEELRSHNGTQFCPSVVGALERVYREEPQTLGGAMLRALESGPGEPVVPARAPSLATADG